MSGAFAMSQPEPKRAEHPMVCWFCKDPIPEGSGYVVIEDWWPRWMPAPAPLGKPAHPRCFSR